MSTSQTQNDIPELTLEELREKIHIKETVLDLVAKAYDQEKAHWQEVERLHMSNYADWRRRERELIRNFNNVNNALANEKYLHAANIGEFKVRDKGREKIIKELCNNIFIHLSKEVSTIPDASNFYCYICTEYFTAGQIAFTIKCGCSMRVLFHRKCFTGMYYLLS